MIKPHCPSTKTRWEHTILISQFNTYLMPRIDKLIEQLGPARFITTLDLTKGYWQVPLTSQAKPKTAFSTPEGALQCRVLPFGVHGAPATFQRLMDRVLCPHQQYASALLSTAGVGKNITI